MIKYNSNTISRMEFRVLTDICDPFLVDRGQVIKFNLENGMLTTKLFHINEAAMKTNSVKEKFGFYRTCFKMKFINT
jgi:hypothetical protein